MERGFFWDIPANAALSDDMMDKIYDIQKEIHNEQRAKADAATEARDEAIGVLQQMERDEHVIGPDMYEMMVDEQEDLIDKVEYDEEDAEEEADAQLQGMANLVQMKQYRYAKPRMPYTGSAAFAGN